MKRLALAVAILIGLATPSLAGHQAAGAAAYGVLGLKNAEAVT